MKKHPVTLVLSGLMLFIMASVFFQCSTQKGKRQTSDKSGDPDDFNQAIRRNADDMMDKGKAVFRFETFGDEVFWTDKLQLHKAVVDAKHGGIGEGLTPKAALAAG